MTAEEGKFLTYWSGERLKKRQFLRKLSIGMPVAILAAGALLVNLLSGWYEKADMELHRHSSLLVVILAAVVGIVVFVTIFSARHRWDRNESDYQSLLRKKEEEQGMQQEHPN